MEIQIHYYQHSDYDETIKLLDKTFGTDIDRESFESHYIDETHNIIVAKTESGNICGCALFEKKVDFLRNNPVLFLSYLAVSSEYKRNGVGRSLVKHIEQICKEMNCSAIELTSADFRVEAHRFYESIGFSRKKTTVFIKEIQ